MVNSSLCPLDTGLQPSSSDLELADVVRRFAPEYVVTIRTGDDAVTETGPFGYRGLLYQGTGRTVVPLRRLPRDVLAFSLLPQSVLSEMSWKTDARVAPEA